MRAVLPLALAAACAATDAPPDDVETDEADAGVYADPALWACRPGKEGDVCAMDLTATELHPDGSASVVVPERAESPPFDCFYVYPTVDLFSGGLDTDFSEPGAKLDPLLSQAAPFTRLCDVYAPYYRQVALNAFAEPGNTDDAISRTVGRVIGGGVMSAP